MDELDFLPRELVELAGSYEGEPYWPLARAGDVIDAIARSGRAVTGVEHWRFESGSTGPRVLRFASGYRLKGNAPWPEVVDDARQKARDELLSMRGADTVCQIGWLGPSASDVN